MGRKKKRRSEWAFEGSHHNGAVAAHYRTGQADRAIARSVNEREGGESLSSPSIA